jgi:small subunit ribosomal protein S27Ae
MGEKKPRRKRKPINTWKFFKKEGDSVKRLRKSCPKCGAGVFMAQHKGRITCGKCHYAEFETKKKEAREEQGSSVSQKPSVSVKPKKEAKPKK